MDTEKRSTFGEKINPQPTKGKRNDEGRKSGIDQKLAGDNFTAQSVSTEKVVTEYRRIVEQY